MPAITRNSVPVARRQLLAEPAKLVVALVAVGAAVALVLLLSGLRRGIGEQVTVYLDHQPSVLVGQTGARDFLSQTSVLPERVAAQIADVPGVADAAPISEGYAMLTLHGRRVLTLLIGYDPGRRGGPWQLAAGREPRNGEIVLDRVLAGEHDLEVGSTLPYGGRELTVVGLSRGTSGFMTPLAFTTRATANALTERPKTATFVLVTPKPGAAAEALTRRIDAGVPGVSAVLRDTLAARDRDLVVGAFSGPLLAMVTIAAVVAVMVIALTVYTSTRDRSREYATMKAVGLGRRSLLRLVAVQAGVLALAGSALGVLLAVAAKRGVAEWAPKYLIALTPADIAAMALAALAFALFAGSIPARYLARLDPAEAFRR
ncbi:MAG TPA: ABC transporter permease [Gaiellaceae bacterium]|nr:ABC transporter permease [Gaiellaceae bacterium]